MPSSSDKSLHPSAAADRSGGSVAHNELREISANDIPSELWDKLESFHPEHRDVLRLIRHRLIDSRSPAINAGTALTLFTALSAAQNPPASDKILGLLEVMNKRHSDLISNLKNYVAKVTHIPKWWQRIELWMIAIATISIIAIGVGIGSRVTDQIITSQTVLIAQITANDTRLLRETQSQHSLTRDAFHSRLTSSEIKYRILPAGTPQVWIQNPFDPTTGQWEVTNFVQVR